MRYAAKVEDGTVVASIRGDAKWAADRLGGVWHEVDSAVSIGYLHVDGEFRPPAPFPSWQFDGDTHQPPVPAPTPGEGQTVMWNEEDGEWLLIDDTEDEQPEGD